MGAQWIVFVLVFSVLAIATASDASINGLPKVQNISAMEPERFPGMVHLTIAGAYDHGTKEVEVWLGTTLPGGHTPIHRHECEEILIILKGSGTLYLASNPNDGGEYPGTPQEIPMYANSSVVVPPNVVHQAWNTNPSEDLHAFAIISRPPMKLHVYKDWYTPHTEAKFAFPPWEMKYAKPAPTKDEL